MGQRTALVQLRCPLPALVFSRPFMKALVLAPVLFAFVLGSLAVAEDARPQGQIPHSALLKTEGARELHDVPYVTGGHERQKLDLYLPAKNGSLHPVLAWIHGGAWEAGNKDFCPAKVLLAKNYAVVSIGYRLSQHAIFPAQIEDCKAAIRWLRAHAAEYDIDPNRIGVWGESAGGHLAAMLGTTGKMRDFDVGENLDQSSAVECVIDWYGPSDFAHYGNRPPNMDPKNAYARLIGGLPTEHLDQVKRSSPISYVQADAAPFLIMQGDKDPIVPAQQSEELDAALHKVGVESTLRIVSGAGHGGPAFVSPANIEAMSSFLDHHLLQSQSGAGQ